MDKKLEKLKERQNNLFHTMAETLGGVAAPVRIKLIHFLSQGPLPVETLASKIDQSVANTSMHLRKMLSEDLVSVSVDGKRRIYSLHPAMFAFWESCQDFIQALNPSLKLEIEDVYGDVNWSERLKSTVKMLKNEEVVLLDARPHDEMNESLEHLKIIQIPSGEVRGNLSLFPKKKPVLVFCRGRFCALSAYVVNELRKHGIEAYRLNESWYSLKKMAG